MNRLVFLGLVFYFNITWAQNNCAQTLLSHFISKEQNYAEYLIDIRERAPYLTPEQQGKLKIQIENGLVLDSEKNPIHTFGYAKAFVMDENLNIFIMQEKFLSPELKKMRTHHSHLSGGKKITAAGQIKITRGTIEYIDNQSGHYTPSPAFLTQFKNQLIQLNANLSRALFYSFPEGPIKADKKFSPKELSQIKKEEETNKIMAILIIPLGERSPEQEKYLQNSNKNFTIDAMQILINYGIKFFTE